MNETIEQKAIRHWKKYPALAEIFEGPSTYADYLRCDFDSLVARCIKEKECSKAEAIKTVAREYPDLHRKWISVINIITKGE